MALLCIALAYAAVRVTNAQTFVAGQITVGDISSVDNKAFAVAHVQVKGEVFAAMASEDQAWGINKIPLLNSTSEVQYPIWGSVKCSDGKFKSVFPVVLKAKVDIEAGHVIHSDGYEIEVKRSVKAGDSIPAIRVGDTSVVSAEAAEGAKKSSEARPWFTAFKEDTKANDRSTIIEAWRIENDHVGVTPAQTSTWSAADITAWNKMMGYYNSAIAKNSKGDLDGAVADCTKAIELVPDDDAEFSNVTGLAMITKGDLDGANADHAKAIELNSEALLQFNWQAGADLFFKV